MGSAHGVPPWGCSQGNIEAILGERGIRNREDEPPSKEQGMQPWGEGYSLSLLQPLSRLQPFSGSVPWGTFYAEIVAS